MWLFVSRMSFHFNFRLNVKSLYNSVIKNNQHSLLGIINRLWNITNELMKRITLIYTIRGLDTLGLFTAFDVGFYLKCFRFKLFLQINALPEYEFLHLCLHMYTFISHKLHNSTALYYATYFLVLFFIILMTFIFASVCLLYYWHETLTCGCPWIIDYKDFLIWTTK